MSVFEFNGEKCAEVVISDDNVIWYGEVFAPLPVSYQLIREGLMERLHEFGPFEVIGDRPDIEIKFFRRCATS